MNLAQALTTACAFFSVVSATVYTVTVGEGSFEPHLITGFDFEKDQINFVFDPPGSVHTVTEAAFDKPCQPSGYRGGIDITTDFLVSLAERKTDQWWFYSGIGVNTTYTECNRFGMVFAVNTVEQEFTAFRNRAMNLPASGDKDSQADSICPTKDRSCAP